MIKKFRIYIISSFILFAFALILSNTNDNKLLKENQKIYALTVDGEKQSNIPPKGLYKVTVDCSYADGRWDYDEWKLYIDNLSDDVTCKIDFVTITKDYFNNYIVGLLGTTQGVGQVVNEYGYRYEGKNPNNYVWFNNELWRIIGVFDDKIHGQSGKQLVKVIRNEPIGAFALHAYSNYGNWGIYHLKNLLNEFYYNKKDGTNSSYCYGYGKSGLVGNCDFTSLGLNDIYRKMIKNSTWYLGGGYSFNNVVELYSSEFETTKTTTGYIGLMNLTDYGFSALTSACPRTSKFTSKSCGSSSWLNGFVEWTLTNWNLPGISGGWNYWLTPGSYGESGGTWGNNVRPTLYLNENVYVLDGDGSITDPYIIAMDDEVTS